MSISGVKRSMDQEGCQNRIAHPRFQVYRYSQLLLEKISNDTDVFKVKDNYRTT